MLIDAVSGSVGVTMSLMQNAVYVIAAAIQHFLSLEVQG